MTRDDRPTAGVPRAQPPVERRGEDLAVEGEVALVVEGRVAVHHLVDEDAWNRGISCNVVTL